MMIRRAGILLVATTIACGSGIPDQPGTRLNALFESERIFVILPIAGSSDSLRLYTDTGGGLFVFGHFRPAPMPESACHRLGDRSPRYIRAPA